VLITVLLIGHQVECFINIGSLKLSYIVVNVRKSANAKHQHTDHLKINEMEQTAISRARKIWVNILHAFDDL